MATLTPHQPINTLQARDGNFTIIESHQIRVTDGFRTQNYLGDFAFSNDAIISGTLKSTSAYQNGGFYYEVTDLNLDAPTMAGYIDNFNIGAALNGALKGDDLIFDSASNDVIKGGTGDHTIDGGGEITAAYNSKEDLLISGTADAKSPAWVVKADGKIDVLCNVERIGVDDGSTLSLDVNAGENTGAAYRLYQAAFDRKPDSGGLKWWIDQLDNGMSLTPAAQGFVDSTELKALNPGLDATSIISSYYENIFHSAPAAGGPLYWENAMASGNTNAAHMLVTFSESAENIRKTSGDISSECGRSNRLHPFAADLFTQ